MSSEDMGGAAALSQPPHTTLPEPHEPKARQESTPRTSQDTVPQKEGCRRAEKPKMV